MVTNEGIGDLQISSVSLTGADAGDFGIASDSGETTLAPGGTRTVQVAFDPASEGAKSATLTIASNADDEPTVEVSLAGYGVLVPDITVSPGSLNFGYQGVDAGPTPSRQVTITNIGAGKLMMSGVSLTGADAAEFAIDSDSGEVTLTLGATRTVQVSFDPSSLGAKSAKLRVVSDDGDEPTENVALSGTGVPGDSGWFVFLPLVLNNH